MKQIHYLCKNISYGRRHKSFESQPDLATVLKITDLLKIDIKELIVREYDAFLREKMKKK